MKTIIVIILLFGPVLSYGQSVDSIFYTGSTQLKQVKTWNKTKDTVYIQEWYPSGQKLATVFCVTEERRLAPIPEAKIFYENGGLFQHINKNNVLQTYDREGRLLEKLEFNYKDTLNVNLEYFENGNKKTEKINLIPNDGRKLITGLWFGYSPNHQRSYMYQQTKGSPITIIEYHPNGKPMHIANLSAIQNKIKWEHAFFDTTGTVMKGTKYDATDPQWPTKYKKYETWVSYYQNGNMEKKENYNNDNLDGEQWYWHENGQLKEHSVYTNGFKKIIESYTEDGKPINK